MFFRDRVFSGRQGDVEKIDTKCRDLKKATLAIINYLNQQTNKTTEPDQ